MRTLMRYRQLFLVATVCSMGFGCATISDCTYECKQKVRTEKAWLHYDGCEDACYSLPYRHGWKAGYYDVVTGGDGCPPMFAPERYSSPFKILHHCDEPRHDWYIGFQEGAMCARQCPDTHYLKAWMPPPPMCPVSSHREVFQPADAHIEQIVDPEFVAPEAVPAEAVETDEVTLPAAAQPPAAQIDLVPQPAPQPETAPAIVPESVAPAAEAPKAAAPAPPVEPAAPPLAPSPSDQSSAAKPEQHSFSFRPASPRRVRTVSAQVDIVEPVALSPAVAPSSNVTPAPVSDNDLPSPVEDISEPSTVVPKHFDAEDFTFVITTA